MKITDRTIRRLVPAVPVLSRVRALMIPLDLIDRVVNLPYREFRALPPNRMRIRVGVGNRLLFNAAQFRTMPIAFWIDALERGVVRLDSHIVDLGCGCGRFALTLRDLAFHDRAFAGHYLGVDVDEEMLRWCRDHFPADRFTFHRVDTYSRTYNPAGNPTGHANGAPLPNGMPALPDHTLLEPKPARGAPGPLRLPLHDATQDFVFAQSLFSHLLEPDFVTYLRESCRVLRPGGWMQLSVFCLEHADQSPGSRWSFSHAVGPARVENLRYPEAAVAYPLAWLESTCRACGFSGVEVMPSSVQTMLVCRK
jgi:ubiquinone/menaquinone biosynthesis C-methylase UbiE